MEEGSVLDVGISLMIILTFHQIKYREMKNINEFTIFDVEDYLKHRYPAISLILNEALNNRRCNPIAMSNLGLCAQLKVNMSMWDWEVFRRYWFTPERFDIEYLYKMKYFYQSGFVPNKDTLWVSFHISEILPEERRTCYWFPLTGEYTSNRLEILEKAVIKFEEQYG